MNGFNAVGVDIQSFILYLVNFGILYFIISKFLVKPVLNILKKRQDLIEKNLKESENIKVEMLKEKQNFLSEQQQMKIKMDQEMRDFERSVKESLLRSEQEIEKKKSLMLEQAQASILQAKRDIYDQIKNDLISTIHEVTKQAQKNNQVDIKESVEKALDR